MPYAMQAKTYTDILLTLSEDTWGFSISLQEYPNNPMELMEQRIQEAKKKKKKTENIEYSDL
jgi:hypothetical protein